MTKSVEQYFSGKRIPARLFAQSHDVKYNDSRCTYREKPQLQILPKWADGMVAATAKYPRYPGTATLFWKNQIWRKEGNEPNINIRN
jgi:hypothetical protein